MAVYGRACGNARMGDSHLNFVSVPPHNNSIDLLSIHYQGKGGNGLLLRARSFYIKC